MTELQAIFAFVREIGLPTALIVWWAVRLEPRLTELTAAIRSQTILMLARMTESGDDKIRDEAIRRLRKELGIKVE